MIGQRYQEKKAAVLDVLRRYQSIRGVTDDGVDAAFLEQRATALRTGQYVLAVVGEAKAGKSTLINALLGERILPTDVLQSSGAVVEILKSDKKFVKVRYADGHSECVCNDGSSPDVDEAVEHLRRIGALQDQYRSIPTALIDAYIVRGRIAKGAPLPIDELKHKSGLSLDDQKQLIAKYVDNRSLAQIPVEIAFGFPLKYAFDELRLVDSPGVNASGGVQDSTFSYLHKANAVLFVHSLEAPVELGSFRDFITHVVPNRTKQTLFLVLSKSGLLSEIEREEKVSEACSLFREWFDPQRVIHVDSMLQSVWKDIHNFDSPVELKKYYAERQKHYEARYRKERRQEWREEVASFDKKLLLLNDTLETTGSTAEQRVVARELRGRSNFGILENAIEEFSATAPDLQLSELLKVIKQGYENQLVEHDQTIDLLGRKKQHPQTFENEITEIQHRLDEYRLLMNEFGERTAKKYTGLRPSFRSKIDQLRSEYIGKIKDSPSIDGLRKTLADFGAANQSFFDGIAAEIRQDYVDELDRKGEQFKADHSIVVPKVDVAGIEEKAKETAYIETEVERDPEGWYEWMQKIVTLGFKEFKELKKGHDSDLFLSTCQGLAVKGIEETVTKGRKLVSDLVGQFSKSFRRDLESLILSRQRALEDLRVRKSTNDEILMEIEEATRKKKAVATERNRVDEMLEDLR